MRPSRLRPLRPRAARPAGGAASPLPKLRAPGIGETGRKAPEAAGLHSPACPRPPPSPSWGGGPRPRPPCSARRRPRPRTPPCSPPPTCSSTGRPSSSPPTARRRRRRGRRHGAPAPSTGSASPRPASRAWPPGCATSPRCPTRSARSSTAGAAPTASSIERRAGAPRGRRDHLREPAQRHQRRRRHLPEVGQRGAAPGLGERAALQPGDRRGAARRRRPRPGCPADCVLLVDDVRHEAAVELMQLTDVVDCLIPRGGPALHPEHPRARHRPRHHRRRRQLPRLRRRRRRPRPGARHRGQRQDAAARASATRPSRCVVHEAVADAFLPRVGDALVERGVELRRRRRRPAAVRPAMGAATDDDFAREFLDAAR